VIRDWDLELLVEMEGMRMVERLMIAGMLVELLEKVNYLRIYREIEINQ